MFEDLKHKGWIELILNSKISSIDVHMVNLEIDYLRFHYEITTNGPERRHIGQ